MSGQIDEAEVVAATSRVTPAEREALNGLTGRYAAGPDLDGHIVDHLCDLRRDGLVKRFFADMDVPEVSSTGDTISVRIGACWYFRLTPLGLAVRKHLEAQR